MMNGHDYRHDRSDRDYYDEPHYRSLGEAHEEPYYHGYGRSYYDLSHRGCGHGGYYDEPYGGYDYVHYEYSDRSRGPNYWRGAEGGYREPRYRGPYNRGAEHRGFFERIGDEIRSWLGDEEAERRRRMGETRRGAFAGRGPRGYRRSDERIREDVNELLTDDWRVDASDIEVSVDNGVVTLAGRVYSRKEKRRAEDIAESAPGVTDVNNQLRVGPSVPFTTETAEATRARTARTRSKPPRVLA
jgi:osmotically-inducible protein OsmY